MSERSEYAKLVNLTPHDVVIIQNKEEDIHEWYKNL
jgi:hypothetical protein